MQARELLTEIYLSAEVEAVVKRLQPEHLQEDIKQHAFTELIEKPAEFIEDLASRGKLKAYIVKILWNSATYARTPLRKQLGKETPTDINAFAGTISDVLDTGEKTGIKYTHTSKVVLGVSKYQVEQFQTDEDHKAVQEMYRDALCAMDDLYWYDRGIFELYLELGTYQAVSDKTGISRTSVYMTVQSVKAKLKNKIT